MSSRTQTTRIPCHVCQCGHTTYPNSKGEFILFQCTAPNCHYHGGHTVYDQFCQAQQPQQPQQWVSQQQQWAPQQPQPQWAPQQQWVSQQPQWAPQQPRINLSLGPFGSSAALDMQRHSRRFF